MAHFSGTERWESVLSPYLAATQHNNLSHKDTYMASLLYWRCIMTITYIEEWHLKAVLLSHAYPIRPSIPSRKKLPPSLKLGRSRRHSAVQPATCPTWWESLPYPLNVFFLCMDLWWWSSITLLASSTSSSPLTLVLFLRDQSPQAIFAASLPVLQTFI